MSKHKTYNKSRKKGQKKAPASRKQIIIIVALAVALVVVGVVGFAIYARQYGNQNHAQQLSADERYEYNYMLTYFGQINELTGTKEVLIVDTITKTVGGDTNVIFYIYQYEDESLITEAWKMTNEQISADSRFEYMGFGEVTLVDDEFVGMSNMRTVYVK